VNKTQDSDFNQFHRATSRAPIQWGHRLIKKTKGQVAVEYVLLLVVAVTIAALVIKLVASRNPDSPGLIVTKWQEVMVSIGKDMPD